jgi:hypothetical protein
VKLELMRKTFVRFDRQLCLELLDRDWWLTGCKVATFRDLV